MSEKTGSVVVDKSLLSDLMIFSFGYGAMLRERADLYKRFAENEGIVNASDAGKVILTEAEKAMKSGSSASKILNDEGSIHEDLIQTIHDAYKHAEDTIWVSNIETLFDRLTAIYESSGGCMARLHSEFPDSIPEPESK